MTDTMKDIMDELEKYENRVEELEAKLTQVESERDEYFLKLEIIRKYLNSLKKQSEQFKQGKKV